MMRTFSLLTGFVICMLASGQSIHAAQQSIYWQGGTSNWNNAGNWDLSIVPFNGNGGNTYVVYIDADTFTNSVVTMDLNPSVEGLGIAAGDVLNMPDNTTLTIGASLLTNNGTIHMNSAGNFTNLIFTNNQTIMGNGSIVMGTGSTNNRIYSNGAIITNGAGHTIQGQGQLLVNAAGMINNGFVIADQAGYMTIDPNGNGFTNAGTMQATGTGGFAFIDGVFTNTGYSIGVTNGSHLLLNGSVSIVGGVLSTSGTGQIINAGSNTLDGVTLNGTLNLNDNTTLTILHGITNNGSLNLNSAGNFTTLYFQNSQTIDGNGTLVLGTGAAATNRILGNNSQITNASTHTIRGQGQLLGNSASMINNGSIIADQNSAMTIDPNGNGFVNAGTMQANGTGGFVFIDGNFTNTGHNIDIADGSKLNLAGNVQISGGTLNTAGTGFIVNTSTNTLNAVTLAGKLNISDNTTLNIIGGITDNGTINLNSSGNFTNLYFQNSQTLDGNGTVVLGTGAAANNRILGNNSQITHGASHTIRGQGQLLGNSASMINNGSIIADQNSAMTIDPNGNGFTNAGTMQANGAGGFVFIDGNFTNTGYSIDIANGSKLNLAGNVQISGGTLNTTGTGYIVNTSINTFNAVTLNGTLNINDNTTLNITSGLTNNGDIHLNSVGNFTQLIFVGNQTLGGTGTLVLGTGAATTNRILGNNSQITHGASHTIRGQGQLLGNSASMINNGSIIADQNSPLTIDPNGNGFVNAGTMQATGAGGFVFLDGNFTNTGHSIDIANGSKLNLAGNVQIIGGTLTTTGTGYIVNTSPNTLNAVTLAGTLNLNDNTTLTITGGITDNGSIHLNSAGNLVNLYFSGNQTISGNGEIVMGSASFNNRIYSNSSQITNGPGHTIRGRGQLLLNSASLLNYGSITADTGNISIDPNGNGMINNGLVRATAAGSLTLIDGTFHNNAGASYIADTTITVNAGASLNNHADATLAGSGTFIINGSLIQNGIIAPGNSPGHLTIQTAALTNSDTSVLAIEIADASTHDLLTVTGTYDVDGTLRVIFLPGAESLAFGDVITIVESSGLLFSNVSNAFDALESQSAGNYDVIYNPLAGTIQLTHFANIQPLVPEPATFALLAGGSLLLLRTGRKFAA